MACVDSFEIPFGSAFSVPVILKTNGEPITFSGTLLFMVKKSLDDADEDAIISKTLTIVNTDGDPYHALITFTTDDTTNPIGKYWYGFKTGETGEWLPTKNDVAEITKVVIQGQTA